MELFRKLFSKKRSINIPFRNKTCYSDDERVNYCHNSLEGHSMIKATELSCYIIQYNYDKENIISFTNLKLQKILYYVQGYYLKKYGKPLFDDKIYNWPYGPVVPEAYFKFNIYGNMVIPSSEGDCTINKYLSRDEFQLINRVIDKCLPKRASELVHMSHNEDPWKNSNNREEILEDAIQQYFKNNDPLKIEQ